LAFKLGLQIGVGIGLEITRNWNENGNCLMEVGWNGSTTVIAFSLSSSAIVSGSQELIAKS